MARSPRLLLPQSFYHIMTRGNNRNIVFRAPEDYLYYLNQLRRFKKELPFDLFHYCLMPNHVHMLIRVLGAANFSLFMKKINLAYFFHYKVTYGWVGHFWQDRFKSQPVGKDNYFLQCGKYIEQNPVRAGLVKKPNEYRYSSYKYYALGKFDDLITEDLFYDSLANNTEERRLNYVNILITDQVKENYKRKVWGVANQRYNESRKINYHLG